MAPTKGPDVAAEPSRPPAAILVVASNDRERAPSLLDEAGWRLRSDWELAAHPLDGFERVEPALDSTIDPRVFAASLRMSLTFATTDSVRRRVARATTTKRPS
jgi:hypothetical protein